MAPEEPSVRQFGCADPEAAFVPLANSEALIGGLGFRVLGFLGFRVWGLGLRVLGFRV